MSKHFITGAVCVVAGVVGGLYLASTAVGAKIRGYLPGAK